MRLASSTAVELSTPQDAAKSRERLQVAARELESQFAQLMLKSMRSATTGDPLLGDNTMYRDMYDQQMSRELTKGRGLGLAPMIVQQLERSMGTAAPVAAPTGPMTLPGRMPAATLPMAMPYSNGGSMMKMAGSMTGGFGLAPSSHGVSMQAISPAALPRVQAPPPPAFDSVEGGHSVSHAACDSEQPFDCSSPEAFVQSIWPHAQRTAKELGVSAKALVAQAALETGWGRRLVGGDKSHNLFGIKATGWSGQRVSSGTHEFVNGVRQNQRAEFRAYDSVHESFNDYAKLMRNGRYAGALAAGDDPTRFATALQQAGYATDPSYAAKISAIVNGPTLQRAISALDAPVDNRTVATLPATAPRG